MKNYRKHFKDYYGIDFSKDYEVHHIDLNHDNNDIKNLMLLPKKLHQEYHSIIQQNGLNCTLNTKIVGFTEQGSRYNYYVLEQWERFLKIYTSCQLWKDYKRFLDGEIEDIHNYDYLVKSSLEVQNG